MWHIKMLIQKHELWTGHNKICSFILKKKTLIRHWTMDFTWPEALHAVCHVPGSSINRDSSMKRTHFSNVKVPDANELLSGQDRGCERQPCWWASLRRFLRVCAGILWWCKPTVASAGENESRKQIPDSETSAHWSGSSCSHLELKCATIYYNYFSPRFNKTWKMNVHGTSRN